MPPSSVAWLSIVPPKRIQQNVRIEMILDEAVHFFAERGFEAQIRDLADRLKISHSLIFRYFGTKQNLIDQVYQRVYVERWDDQWVTELQDRTISLKKRVETFYQSFLKAMDNPEWIRIALFGGLLGEHLPRSAQIRNPVEKALTTIIYEMRRERGDKSRKAVRVKEWEFVSSLHASFVYYLMRKYVVDHPPYIDDRTEMIRTVLDIFFPTAKA